MFNAFLGAVSKIYTKKHADISRGMNLQIENGGQRHVTQEAWVIITD